MAKKDQIVNYINELLDIYSFNDYGPNGLQVDGKDDVKSIVSGVSINLSFLQKAVELKADMVMVHHGLFWKQDSFAITGIKYARLKLLFDHGISLCAYHLPLDAHPVYGNNATFGNLLGFRCEKQVEVRNIPGILSFGVCSNAYTPMDLSRQIESKLQRTPLYIEGRSDTVTKVAWCTGAAQDFIMEAYQLKVDAYITGEVSERTVHLAKELGIHFYAAGHHATERYGVQSLGEHLAKTFQLKHTFVDIPNPV